MRSPLVLQPVAMASSDLETFMGPCFILICLALILYGIFCAQAFYYWTTYQDSLGLKLLIFVVCVLESVHVVTCIHLMYTFLLSDIASPDKLSRTVWSVIRLDVNLPPNCQH
ncbi:hypothetical protein BC835DRAFT_781492 [Cytidiella melzeri]|nr:hypothetical protein BC835DRAFT_781492 [Cytidiella melzeri]